MTPMEAQMTPEDLVRELTKIHEPLQLAARHHELQNEANAALHCSEKVLYSPLTSRLRIAANDLEALIRRLGDDDAEGIVIVIGDACPSTTTVNGKVHNCLKIEGHDQHGDNWHESAGSTGVRWPA